MSKVALVRCDSYEYDKVRAAVTTAIDLLGGMKSFVKQGDRVLLKPNMLCAEDASKSVTTHPSVFSAVAQMVLEISTDVSYGDSPGVGKTENISKKTGIFDEAKKFNVKFADFDVVQNVKFEAGKQNKSFVLAKPVTEADVIISLPKLKTHGLTTMTGAVKNQFGCVPGIRKAQFHLKLPDVNDFARMLADLNACVNPKLYVMDAVYAMEGNGPRSGNPRALNVILVSTDPIAIDSVASRIIGLNPMDVPTIRAGVEATYGVCKEDEIEILGESIEKFKISDFVLAHTSSSLMKKLAALANHPVGKKIFGVFIPKPVIKEEICVKCGICVKVCPVTPEALNFNKKGKSHPPQYYYSKCIKCYCCQELCPHKAIVLKRKF